MTLALLAGCTNTAHNQPPTATCTPNATATTSPSTTPAAATCTPAASASPTNTAAASMQLVEDYIHGKAPTILARIKAQAGVTVTTRYGTHGHPLFIAGGLAELDATRDEKGASDKQTDVNGVPHAIVSFTASPAALRRSVFLAYFVEIYLGHGTASYSGNEHTLLYFAALNSAGQPIRSRDGSYVVLAFDIGPNVESSSYYDSNGHIHTSYYTVYGVSVGTNPNNTFGQGGGTSLASGNPNAEQAITVLESYVGAKVMPFFLVNQVGSTRPWEGTNAALSLIEAYQRYNQSHDAGAFAPFGIPTGNVALWSLPVVTSIDILAQ